MKEIKIKNRSLILLIGTSSSGKSTFAKQYFKPTQIISSDYCRSEVCDNENDMSYIPQGFELLNTKLQFRLNAYKTTVIDATNLRSVDRKHYLEKAKLRNFDTHAVIFNTSLEECQKRHKLRGDRGSNSFLTRQFHDLSLALKKIPEEEFTSITEIMPEDCFDNVKIIVNREI